MRRFSPLLVLLLGMTAWGQEAAPPNLILLVTDDQRHDALGHAGNPIIRTPNMDGLAEEGVYFPNAYVTTSICAVSRATLLSGQYARRHGIHDFATSFSPEAWAQTYPVLLREGGYYTGFIGKFGVGRGAEAMPVESFDEWYGFPGQGTYHQEDEHGEYLHLTRKMGNQAETFLQNAAEQGPFALSISFKAPHVEGLNAFTPDPAFDSLYTVEIPEPVTGDSSYFNAFPDFFKAKNEGRSRWEARFSTPELYQENVKRYYRLITGVDEVVGRIRVELERLGLAENTVILLTSDNGFYLGEHGLAGKWYGHEESIRVPMILYDPRLPETKRGQTHEGIVLNVDVAPTLLILAGQALPEEMQGRSLTALVDDFDPDWRTDFFYEHLFEYDGRIPRSEGVIGPRYKYLRYIDQDPVYEQLFDTEADPHEVQNLADDPAYQGLLQSLRDRWAELREELQ